MAHIPEDDNFDEFMNASGDEWSKPQKPPDKPDMRTTHTDRWGSPLPQKGTASDHDRWGSEQAQPARSEAGLPAKKTGKRPWWIIAIILAAVLCLCLCLLFGLPLLGLNLFSFLPT